MVDQPDLVRGVGDPGFQAVLRLGREAGAVVKLSAPCRRSRRPFRHEDVAPLAAALLDAFGPDRCVWGSHWPCLATTQTVDYRRVLEWLGTVVPDGAIWDRVLREDRVGLFGFSSP